MKQPANPAELIRLRAEALARFATWEAANPATLSPAAALAAIGSLYDLLPAESRRRPVDVSGVRRMHDLLRRLSR